MKDWVTVGFRASGSGELPSLLLDRVQFPQKKVFHGLGVFLDLQLSKQVATVVKEIFATNPFYEPVVPFPGLGGSGHSRSCLNHFP